MSYPVRTNAMIHPDRLAQLELRHRPVIVLSKNNRDRETQLIQPALSTLSVNRISIKQEEEAKQTKAAPNKKRVREIGEADGNRENIENRIVKQCTETKTIPQKNEVKKTPPPPPPRQATTPLLPPGIKPPTLQSWINAVNTIVLSEIKSDMIDVPEEMVTGAKSKQAPTDTLQKMEMLLVRQLNEFSDLQGAVRRAIMVKVKDLTETKARILAFSAQ